MPVEVGDAVVNFTAKTEELDKEMNALFDKIERTVRAARIAWNGYSDEDKSTIHCWKANPPESV